MKRKHLPCRVVITHNVGTFSLGMYDPVACNYAPLGTHPKRDIDKVVRGLKERMEQEGHDVSFSEVTGPR